ncbi:MAG: type IV secretory system conjugative DNA transfer family protein [Sulfitobacter sp.]
MADRNEKSIYQVAVPAMISAGIYAGLRSGGADMVYQYMAGGVACIFNAQLALKFLSDTAEWNSWRKLSKPQGIHGTTEELNSQRPKDIGLSECNKDGEGIYLGSQSDPSLAGKLWPKLLYYKGDGHCLFQAGTGGGKTSSVAGPIRLGLGAERNAIITAKDADMAVQFHRFLTQELGQQVVCIDPYRLMERHGIKSDDLNPFWRLIELAEYRSPEAIEKAKEIAKVLLPEPGGAQGDNKLFRDNGRDFLTWSLLFLAIEEAETGELCCNPAHLNGVLADGADQVTQFFMRMTCFEDYDGEIARAGRRFLGKFKNTAKTAEGFLTEAQTALDAYVPASRIGKSVRRSTFNPADLKTRGKKMTVFIILPAGLSDVNEGYVGLCLNNLARRCIEANTFLPRVTIIADEFEALSKGPLPVVETILKLGRSKGVQLCAFIQAKTGGLEARYKDLAPMFESQSAITMYWDMRNVKEAEEASKRAGQRSVMTESSNVDQGSVTVQETGIPLLRLDQIMRRPKFQSILFKENHSPMILDLVHYKQVSPWNTWVDPVPGAQAEPDFKVRFKA